MIEVAAGIDIGGTNTEFGLVDRSGKCLFENEVMTDKFETVEEFVADLSAGIKKLIQDSKSGLKLKGIGIGAPNGNFYKGTVEFAPNLRWKGVLNFVEMFGKHFPEPAVLTNDANAAAIGEMMYGAAKGMKDFIVITLGTGLGSGFVANGELIYGHDGFAGELGHTIAVPDGRKCKCGRQGCLEQYASATGIVITVKEMLNGSNAESTLLGIDEDKLTSKKIYEAALAGDKLSLDAFDQTAHILGRSLSDAVAITSPEAIILFGGLAQAGDLILVPTKKYMELYMLNIFKNKVKVVLSRVAGENAAVLGASALVWKTIS